MISKNLSGLYNVKPKQVFQVASTNSINSDLSANVIMTNTTSTDGLSLYSLNFYIPKGQSISGSIGPQGPAGTIAINSVSTVSSSTPASVTNIGTPSAAILNFNIPQGITGSQGNAGTIAIGTVNTVNYDVPASIVNVGTPSSAILNFSLPKGQSITGATGSQGPSGTLTIGTVNTVNYDVSASVVNVGTSQNSILNFSLPKGQSITGPSGTLTIGTISTVNYDVSASVVNVGTPSSAILNFSLPRGFNGNNGISMLYVNQWNAATTYIINNVVYYSTLGQSYVCISGNTAIEPTNTSYWALMVKKGDTGPQGPQGNNNTLASAIIGGLTGAALGIATSLLGSMIRWVDDIFGGTQRPPTDTERLTEMINQLFERVQALEQKTQYMYVSGTKTGFLSTVVLNNGSSDRITFNTNGTSEFYANMNIQGSQTVNGVINCDDIDFITNVNDVYIGRSGSLLQNINIGNPSLASLSLAPNINIYGKLNLNDAETVITNFTQFVN